MARAERWLITLLLMSGCVNAADMPELPETHPANPKGASGMVPSVGRELESDGESLGKRGMEGSGGGKSPHEHGAPTMDGMYQCPMHDEIRSNKPGRCPVCGMKLKKASKDSH